MTDKEVQIACLRAELMEYLSETAEKDFDVCRLDEILDRLEALDPIPLQTFQDDETALRKFREKRNLVFGD